MRSHLLEGTVRHRRSRPVYTLEHGVFYLALDLDEIDEVAARLRLVGRNGPSILAFRDDDHFDPPARDVRQSVREVLRGEGIDPDGWQVTLVTNLRVLGYVFNPASFYLCRDSDGTLRLVIIEVHNTHGERHLYVLRPQRGAGDDFGASMAKDFYVSPFLDMDGRYTVRVRDEPSRLRITINEFEDDALLLHASVDLVRRRLSDRTVMRMLVRYPLVTLKTIGAIHWHALQLWRRGVPFRRHGAVAR